MQMKLQTKSSKHSSQKREIKIPFQPFLYKQTIISSNRTISTVCPTCPVCRRRLKNWGDRVGLWNGLEKKKKEEEIKKEYTHMYIRMYIYICIFKNTLEEIR